MDSFNPLIESISLLYYPNIDSVSVDVKTTTYENTRAMVYGLVTFLVEHEIFTEDEMYHTVVKGIADGLKVCGEHVGE